MLPTTPRCVAGLAVPEDKVHMCQGRIVRKRQDVDFARSHLKSLNSALAQRKDQLANGPQTEVSICTLVERILITVAGGGPGAYGRPWSQIRTAR